MVYMMQPMEKIARGDESTIYNLNWKRTKNLVSSAPPCDLFPLDRPLGSLCDSTSFLQVSAAKNIADCEE